MVGLPTPGVTRIAGAAALIAVLTVLARLAGFGRTLVFAWAVGDNDLGDIYFAANLIPNIIFEIVAGGALASLVVPLLAGSIAAGDRAAVARTTAALLTWAMTLLIPLAVVMAVAAHPIIALLTPDAADPEQVAAGARMLQIFAPQLPLYGIGIVLTGVLQAHRRFAWPVLAPLLSSLTVAAAYFGFTLVDGRGTPVAELSTAGLLVLAVGTTVGVVVLAGVLVPPVLRLRVWARPTWRFDPAARRRVAGLAGAGAITVAAQHLALLVVLWQGLAGPEGTPVLFMFAQTIFLLPWAVLAVPLATAAYPGLAETAATGAHSPYSELLARTTRGVLLLSWLGAAALAAAAVPVAALLAALMPAAGPESVARLAAGIAGFAPALVGYGLFALLSRALYARGETRAVASAAIFGWATVAVAAIVLSALLPDASRVVALTVANTVGMTVLGAALLVAVAWRAGRSALAGVARAATAGGVGAVLAAAAGWGVARWLTPVTDPPTAGVAVGSGMLAAGVVVAVYAAVVWAADRRDLRPLVATMVRRFRRPAVDASGGGGA
ncbi:virulence factor MviN [Natronosporangium hydrolyticum]|uniref:Virulence factor MviN n=1 Tax=Natronosporangium hydrolyticum TaxID=2811111 RepID=A0A895YR80_9ACTN|nr:virulence factor MviN [Natronosporangium hydrolyticum]